MKKIKSLVVFVLMAVTFIFSSAAYGEENINVYINNNEISFEQQPVIKNNYTLVPMRTIFTTLGYNVYWDDSEKTVVAIGENNTIQLWIDSTIAFVDGQQIFLDSPATIENGYTLVPLRFIAESSGCEVNWSNEEKAVYITTENPVFYNTENIELSDNTHFVPSADEKVLAESVVKITTDKMQGSGVIVHENGYIATNYHVVEGAERIQIRFNDNSFYADKFYIAGYDSKRDLVILKISKTGLKPVVFRDSSTVKPGEKVISIGSPYGYFNLVTTGVVYGSTGDIIGTSAPIAPGSSGGALFDENGYFIGVVSAYDTDEHYLSIPANYILDIDITKNIPLVEWKNYTPTVTAPEKLTSIYTENGLEVYWDPVYGADYYYIYYSSSPNGEFKKLKNSAKKTDQWQWAYPTCFTINNFNRNEVIYMRISAVKDDVETEKSDVFKIN